MLIHRAEQFGLRSGARRRRILRPRMIWIASYRSSKRAMVKVELKGIAKVTAKGRTYWYAGAAALACVANRAPRVHCRLQRSDRGPARARHQQVPRRRYRVQGEQGIQEARRLHAKELGDVARSYRRPFRHAQHAAIRSASQDQTADTALAIAVGRTSRGPLTMACKFYLPCLSFAVDSGKIAGNPCEGMKRLYDGDRSEIIWLDADIAEFKAVLLAGVGARRRSCGLHGPAAWRPDPAFMVACRGRRNRAAHQQERSPRRSGHSALCRVAHLTLHHPETLDSDPNGCSGQSLGWERSTEGRPAGEGGSQMAGQGFAFPRPARHRAPPSSTLPVSRCVSLPK